MENSPLIYLDYDTSQKLSEEILKNKTLEYHNNQYINRFFQDNHKRKLEINEILKYEYTYPPWQNLFIDWEEEWDEGFYVKLIVSHYESDLNDYIYSKLQRCSY